MIKIRKNKVPAIAIGFIFILVGISIPLSKNLYGHYVDKIEKKEVDDFFKEPLVADEINSTSEENSASIKEKKGTTYNYVAVLEIPSIFLKRGLVSKDSKANNVNQNIQILKDSDMPDIGNGNLLLASHSGSGRVAFFNKLHDVKNNDKVFVYYNNKKYIYKISNSYLETKDGNILVHQNNKNIIVLTTCSQDQKGKQLVVVGELIAKEIY